MADKLKLSGDAIADNAIAAARQAAYDKGVKYVPAIDAAGMIQPVANALSGVSGIVNEISEIGDFARSTVNDSVPSILRPIIFPNDLGADHIPDFIAFYFLDIATTSAEGTTKFINPGISGRNYGLERIEQASKQPIAAATQHMAKDLVNGMAKAGGAIASLAQGVGLDIDPTTVASGISSTMGDFLHLNDNYLRTTDVINLMMPSSIQFSDGAGWQAVNSSPSVFGLIGEVVMAENKLEALKGTAGFSLAKLISSTLYEDGGKAMESVAKKVYNPYVSQAFESMNRRTFRFDWTFTPKNQSELDNILKIIKLFRYHMHPSLETGAMFLRYPSQLEIEFKVDAGGDNVYLPKIARCVIKEFSSNYTPNNQWTTVDAMDPGAPSQYQISIVVEEIVPLVKQDIDEGF